MPNLASRHFRKAALVAAILPIEAFAHPGHDDPEVTWEFSHLVEHPVATLGCFLVIGLAAWAAWRMARRSAGKSDNEQAITRR